MINPHEICLDKLPSVSLEERSQLPETPSIYFALSSGVVQYIGRSQNPRIRWKNHHRYSQLSEMADVAIAYLDCNEELLDDVEQALIEWFDPPLNGLWVEHTHECAFAPSKQLNCQLAVLMAQRDPRLTQRGLAKALGVSHTTINKLYNGRPFNGVLKADIIVKICEYFDCGMADLFSVDEVSHED